MVFFVGPIDVAYHVSACAGGNSLLNGVAQWVAEEIVGVKDVDWLF